MKKTSKFTIERAKRTMFGRLACRLIGDQSGAVLMEYVILGAMIAAAAVALILVFGKGIRERLQEMIDALMGKPKVTTTITDEQIKNAESLGTGIATQTSSGN